MLEQSDEVYDLSIGPFGFPQVERRECWQKMFEVPLDVRYEVWDVQVLYLEFPDVGQCRKLVEGTGVEQRWGEPGIIFVEPTDPQPLDQGKQTETVLALERFLPFRGMAKSVCFNGEGAVEVGDSDDVPGMTGHGACAETAHIVGEISYDHFEDLRGKFGGRG